MLLTFGLTVFAWIFFRAENMGHALLFIQDMFRGLANKEGYIETFNLIYWDIGYVLPFMLLVFIFMEWLGRESQFALQNIFSRWKWPYRYIMYYAIIIAIFWFSGKEQQFIYFQF